MLGVRFLDVDFMRINLAFERRLYRICTFIAQSNREAAALHDRLRDQPARRVPLSLRRAAPVTAGRATTGSAIGPTPAFQHGHISEGVWAGTVQRISKERAMSLRGAQQ